PLPLRPMLDIRLFRNDLETVRNGMSRRGEDLAAVDRVVAVDEELRKLNMARDELRSRIRGLSNEVGQLMRDGRKEEAGELQAESRAMGEQEKELDAESDTLSGALRDLLLRLPNLPSDEAPDGGGEADNVVARVERFEPDAYGEHHRVPHWETGEQLG